MPVRRTFSGEVDAARELVKQDTRAYEKLSLSRRSAPLGGSVHDPESAESNGRERLRVLDAMGVYSALLFPSLGLFWPSTVEDPEVTDANFAAWNNWVVRQAAAEPTRLLAVAQYSLSDVSRAVAEIRRCHAAGIRGFFLRAVPYRDLPWGDESNEAVWQELESSGLPLFIHSGPLRVHPAWDKGLIPNHVGQPLQTFLNRSHPGEAALSDLIFAGVLERHPKLRIGIIEFGSIWFPSFIRRLDFAFGFLGPRNRYMRERLSMLPSDYLRRQVKVSCFWSEPIDWLIESAGPEFFMYSSDYPHPEGNQNAVERALEATRLLPAEVAARFFSRNAQELLGIDHQLDTTTDMLRGS